MIVHVTKNSTMSKQLKVIKKKLSPLVLELPGIISLPKKFNFKKAYSQFLIKKYT